MALPAVQILYCKCTNGSRSFDTKIILTLAGLLYLVQLAGAYSTACNAEAYSYMDTSDLAVLRYLQV